MSHGLRALRSVVGHYSDRQEYQFDVQEEMALYELKIDTISYTEALHEVFRISVAAKNTLTRTLSVSNTKETGTVGTMGIG
jgi:hypothetical protein